MGAKGYILIALLAAPLAGCAASDFQRFVPPGLFKYEDLAGDLPPSPEIQERIAERRAEIDSRYPNLSVQPAAPPPGLTRRERDTERAELRSKRDALEAAADADRAAAEADRRSVVFLPGESRTERSPDEAREILSGAVEAARREAERERAQAAAETDQR